MDVRVGATGGSIDLKAPTVSGSGRALVGTFVGRPIIFNRARFGPGIGCEPAFRVGGYWFTDVFRDGQLTQARGACHSSRALPGVLCSLAIWARGKSERERFAS